MLEMLDLDDTSGGVRLGVRVQPNARRSGIAGVREGRLKIALQAPAVDGKANKALVEFLAELASVPKSGIDILRGEKAREKTVLIRGVGADRLLEILRAAGLESEQSQPED